MKKNELVSIIVPVYNVENYISQCIESLINQKYDCLEIILVDDGSTDSSSKICDDWAKRDNRIIAFHKKNGGVSSARNYGIKKSNGKYICFVDADDYLDCEFVSYMVFLIEQTNSSFAFSKNCYILSNQSQKINDNIICVNSTEATELLLSPFIEVGCWNKIYKSSLLKKNNLLFNEDLFFGEGLDFICRVAQASECIGVGEKMHYYYRKNNLSSATTHFDYSKFINGEKSLLKIKKEFMHTSKKLDVAWNLHYTLFSINALVLLIQNKKRISNYHSRIIHWRNNIKKCSKKLLFSKYVGFRHKVKIIVTLICPYMLVFIKKYKAKRIVELSV